MNEVIVTYLALPMSVNGLVTPTPEGDYQVILNARHSPQMQRETYRHELRHILLNHFSQHAQALAPLEQAASLTRLPNEDAPRKALLEQAIRCAEDSGLSQTDFAPGQPPFNGKTSVFTRKSIEKPSVERNHTGQFPAKKPPKKSTHPPPAPTPPAAPGAMLLRAMRAQLTGLHF